MGGAYKYSICQKGEAMTEKHNEVFEKKMPTIEHAGERLAELERQLDKKELNKDTEARIEQARVEADAEAQFTKEYSTEQIDKNNKDSSPPTTTKTEREYSYKHTMRQVQSQLKAPERVFSKVIHNKAVERFSDITGSTVARPNAILFGSLFAFLGVASLYFFARFMGFSLPGSQTIIAFIIGWIVGLLVDFIRVTLRNNRVE
jgi:hypothetical protein